MQDEISPDQSEITEKNRARFSIFTAGSCQAAVAMDRFEVTMDCGIASPGIRAVH
jgi:hypothetical protein